jgi:hypothetical protein
MDTFLKQRHGRAPKQFSVKDSMIDHRPAQLRAAAEVCRMWHCKLLLDDPQRAYLAPLIDFIDDRIRDADYSIETMSSVRALLCINCRDIHPDLESVCCEQTLEACWLLGSARGIS